MKSKFRKFTRVVIIVTIGLLGLTAATMASDIDWPWSSDPGTVISAPIEQIQIAAADLQPDDNGYAGPIPEASGEVLVPSADEQSETVDWDTLIPESAPDREGNTNDPNWSSFHYYNVAGSTLRPRDSSVNWSTDVSGGCLLLTSGSESVIFNLQLDIPNGARIDYLRSFYYDTSVSNSESFLTLYDTVGGHSDITSVDSNGNTGYGTALSPFIGHTVDSYYYSYVLNYRPNETGSTMQLCGLQVSYRLP